MELLFDDEEMYLASEGRLIVLATRRAPTPDSTKRFHNALRRHADAHADDERLFMLAALGAKRPRLDPQVRTGIIAAWRDPGYRYAVAMWARQKSFAGSLQRSFITALSLLRVRRTPMRLVNGYAAALDWFETVAPSGDGVRDAWRSMLESVPDFHSDD